MVLDFDIGFGLSVFCSDEAREGMGFMQVGYW